MISKSSRLPENEQVPFGDHQPKIEIVRCPQQKSECVAQLPTINQCFNESQQMRLSKDYRLSIQALERAFECTYQMSDADCDACARMFRDLIITTLETLQAELRELTSGWFGARDYQTALDEATHVLQTFRIKR